MQNIRLDAIPNQSFNFNIDDSVYKITVKECGGVMGVTVLKNETVLVENTKALPRVFLLPYKYLDSANFVFITAEDELPYYTEFNNTVFLLYLNPSEIAGLNNGN